MPEAHQDENLIALIGGTGLNQLPGLEIIEERTVDTPYGAPSGPLIFGRLRGAELVFLARHGPAHIIPPHRINYRANLWALRESAVERVLAVAAVGGIDAKMRPGRVAIPHQLIDYTWGREHTYFEGGHAGVEHIDFTRPYSDDLRAALIDAARRISLDAVEEGVYGATQGPRLESAVEIQRLHRDGCDLVGMTGMPEAALARELDLEYACIAAVVNWAAGIGRGAIYADLETYVSSAMQRVNHLLAEALPALVGD
jgi:5'-deoxy-5'-methylthioadenosine phosphorylase